ncbi:hypothetical protein CHELA40_15190 [Chelatococcus asaccharovorans]|nr:hypothetical protein CHELA17_60429 [Chelatococcus asaccharovorans]CAH1681772.1 hypothetical protein CHELA40_15190 [Chelatococcus asaccharovorans]
MADTPNRKAIDRRCRCDKAKIEATGVALGATAIQETGPRNHATVVALSQAEIATPLIIDFIYLFHASVRLHSVECSSGRLPFAMQVDCYVHSSDEPRPG